MKFLSIFNVIAYAMWSIHVCVHFYSILVQIKPKYNETTR